ncbi:hydantoinase/oxoprolinase family protein [Roseomonas sp. AR75]|uniref:hydantoinase/oxoprolinase family protein n=1 Tax=Roseomonas sp. AR75 TaxID=2562311 RepID=UPI0010C01EF1|nr:hydantoinase/oxoprolinase family protein [Roseomonas sp. AR75]
MTAPFRIGVDIGGTFTDLVLLDTRDGRLFNGKILTTPHAPEQAVLDGVRGLLAEHGVAANEIRHVIHGTTLVANALIERRGVKTGFLTTQGFRDVQEIGTELRHDTYDLFMRRPDPLVPRRLRLDIPERLLPDGGIRAPLDEAATRAAIRTLREDGVSAIAVCLLHAFANPAHERRIAELAAEEAPDVALCLSSDLVPEIGEYERGSTTIANAYVLPVFARYLARLESGLCEAGITGPLFLMLSDGGTVAGAVAARHPIRLVQSGPAGGVQAARVIGAAAEAPDVLCFDMGGTTAKAALIDGGQPQRSLDFEVSRVDRFRKGSGLPLKVPVVEMIEIGAGGGSIARVDALGLVRVGPDSASSDPGPACYGLGGTQPTVTDCDLLLGYLAPNSFLGGAMRLDVAAAEAAVRETLAKPLGLLPVEAAFAVHETVNTAMAQAAAIHALEKARSIEGYTLVPIGGAGPVHAVEVARKLGIARLVVPAGAGVASAFGFLAAPISFSLLRGQVAALATLDLDALRAMLAGMETEGRALVAQAGVEAAEIRVRAAMRYAGQGYQVEADVTALDRDALRTAFEAEYRRLYGRVESNLPVECVGWRVTVSGPTPQLDLAAAPAVHGSAGKGTRPAWFGGRFLEAMVHDRGALAAGDTIVGPALIEERESTLVLPPGATARCDAARNLVVTVG